MPINIVGTLMQSTLGRYDLGFFWNFNTGKQILPCVIETRRYGCIRGSGGRVETPRRTTLGCEKNPTMARKEDVFNGGDFLEINTLNHWCRSPCVIKSQRYGYIWDYRSCAEPSHRTNVGCEKMEKRFENQHFCCLRAN